MGTWEEKERDGKTGAEYTKLGKEKRGRGTRKKEDAKRKGREREK